MPRVTLPGRLEPYTVGVQLPARLVLDNNQKREYTLDIRGDHKSKPLNGVTEMTNTHNFTSQIELDYNLATYLREDAEELSLVIEQEGNACGIISIIRNTSELDACGNSEPYLTIYTCEDAKAWGTVSAFKTLEAAQAHKNYVWEMLNI